ncbi:MAG: carboxypeptidase-like regulatory domain-containing protein [Candidatus Thiodiazotropha sp.]
MLSIEQTATTDSYGEALISDLPAGRYRFRASAPNHEDLLGRLTIKPGVTAAQEVFLDFNLITIEWSVTEITIEDKYEITLQAIFETDVPAAVVVMEPTSTTLPEMGVGDVFYGELRLTNYGLIRADNLKANYPSSDAYFQYEFLAELPDTLEAKESLLIPYRVTALSSLAPDGTVSTTYNYTCANGDTTGGSTSHSWTYPVSASSCGGGGGIGGGSIWGGGGGGGGGGSSSGTSTYDSLPSARCMPEPDCEDCCPLH